MAVTDKERKLAATLSDPVLWGQAYLYNRDGSGRDYWPHQVEDLRCPAKNIIHLDGRDVGKSIVLSTDALHYAFTTRGGQGLIAAPHQGHLDTIIEEIEFQLDTVRSSGLSGSDLVEDRRQQRCAGAESDSLEQVAASRLHWHRNSPVYVAQLAATILRRR